jgi:hypothetical protein
MLLSRGSRCDLGMMARRHPVDALFDAPIRLLCNLVHGQPVLHALDSPRHGGGDPLDTPFDGRFEEGDVTLPPGRPLVRLTVHALVAAGGHEVEGGEGSDAGGAKREDLDSGGGGDAERHGGV